MNRLFKKLQLQDHSEVLMLNAPRDFEKNLEMPEGFVIEESLVRVTKVTFALVFVTASDEIEEQMETLAPKLQGDAILWFACPKKPKKNSVIDEFLTDDCWTALGNHRYERVRAVLLNDNWVATRFRKLEFHNKH